MLQGRTLQGLAAEIQRQDKAKRDFLVPTSEMKMVSTYEGTHFAVNGIGEFGLTENAHRQLGEYCGIPAGYYNKLAEYPDMLATNVNHWLNVRGGDNRMIRTLDGNARAFLSDRYRRIDNVQVAETVLPMISRLDGAEVKSCEVTENRMYLKVVNGVTARNYDLYLIEANYIDEEIQEKIREKEANGEFAYERRVLRTHLSKAKCDNFIYSNIGSRGRYVYMHTHRDDETKGST